MSTSTRDIGLHESGSGGEFTILNDDLLLSETLFNTIYIALFGGNVEADTLGNEIVGEERFDYWGNSFVFSDLSDLKNEYTFLSFRNISLEATSSARLISSPGLYPALVMDSRIRSRVSSFDFRSGANPPSSPTAVL